MRPDLTRPPKLVPGDRVAVLSPSFAAPAIFPAVHEEAMRRLRGEFGLEPVEYPTTRRLHADPRDRAADLMNLGLASYHGGSTMVHLGPGGGLHPVSAGSPSVTRLARPNAPATATTSATPCSGPWRPTTPPPWWSSTSAPATPTPSGSSPTAAS
jgi:hypothetical protein